MRESHQAQEPGDRLQLAVLRPSLSDGRGAATGWFVTMLSELVSSGTKALGGARFSLVNVLPGTLLAATVLFTVRSGAYGSGPASLSAVIPGRDELTAGGAVVLLFTLFVAGILVQPFQVALVQYLEGYWSGLLERTLGDVAVELHRRRFLTAAAQTRLPERDPTGTRLSQVVAHGRAHAAWRRRVAKAEATERRYPVDPDRIMPTMLGNILRDAEDTAGSRYGLDAMTVYSRMYPTLSKPLSDAMTRQLDLITLTGSLCVSFALGALATIPVVHRLDWWSLVPLSAVVLGVLSYRGALRAAESHGTLFATVFDLHRFDMLRALHHKVPMTAQDEFKFNKQLTKFLQGRDVPHSELARHEYDHSIYDQLVVPQPATTPGSEEPSQETKKDPADETATADPAASSETQNPPPPER